MQMSAVGVWGNPVALVLRVADLVALPSSQLLTKANRIGMVSSIYVKALLNITTAADMLKDSDCSSPLMSRGELIGMWVPDCSVLH
jgi:hypothetical protein